MHIYSPDCYCIDTVCVSTNKARQVPGLVSTSLSTKSNLSLKHYDHFTCYKFLKPILSRGQLSQFSLMNQWKTQAGQMFLFPEGYFYSFSHTATSLSYSGTAQSCSAFPNTAQSVTAQHLPLQNQHTPAMPDLWVLNKRILQSKIQSMGAHPDKSILSWNPKPKEQQQPVAQIEPRAENRSGWWHVFRKQ